MLESGQSGPLSCFFFVYTRKRHSLLANSMDFWLEKMAPWYKFFFFKSVFLWVDEVPC